jgi:predicted PurR-regulated permease PerM
MHKSSLKDSLIKTYHDVEEDVEQELYDRWHIRLHKRIKHRVHKLRKRPDHHKDAIAFSIAFLVTVLVFMGWYFVSFPNILNSYKTNKKESTVINEISNPIQDFKEQLYNPNIQAE